MGCEKLFAFRPDSWGGWCGQIDRPRERPTCDGDLAGFPSKGLYLWLFPPGTPFGVITPSPCCIAPLSCTEVASDQFSLLATQGQVSDDFAPDASLAVQVLINLPASFLLLQLWGAAGATATSSWVESVPLIHLRWRRSPVPSEWLNQSGRSPVLPHANLPPLNCVSSCDSQSYSSLSLPGQVNEKNW